MIRAKRAEIKKYLYGEIVKCLFHQSIEHFKTLFVPEFTLAAKKSDWQLRGNQARDLNQKILT